MSACVPLLTAVDHLADRFRSMPQSALMGAVGQAGTRGALGFALASRLTEAAQRLEFPDRPPVPLPQVGIFSTGDQIAVAGHDLAAALGGVGGEGGEPAQLEDRKRKVYEDALRDVTETARLV